MHKLGFSMYVWLFVLLFGAVQTSKANEVRLVGNKVQTFINDKEQASRLTDLVSAALNSTPHSITATTQAWSGSGLRNGRFEGYIDHYSLNNPRRDYIYSAPYVTLNLHVASTEEAALDIYRIDQLSRERVGLETRFANTDQVRSERSVKWARAQDFFNNVEQLAEQRVDFIVADKIMLEEMNKLLVSVDQEPLFISNNPIFSVDVSLAMLSDYENAEQVIRDFEAGIDALKSTGSFDAIYYPSTEAESILDAVLYQEILKRW